MVDENLIKEIKENQAKGGGQPSNVLKLMEFLKQISGENEDIKEELEDMDLITLQFEMTDVDYKYWVKLGESKVDYAEGEVEDADVTMKATVATWVSLGSGETDSTSAYMSGDLQIEGNLQDAIAYGEILGMAMEELSSD
ncbi:hypothetical protein LCGC14_1680260 [marine sediment metagenome]|uniref:SCP2 domain-containing protein n=1 Tax=marine sediment metagenome TaxID=412755 RepID=A0A0F9IB80_9ZZZZ